MSSDVPIGIERQIAAMKEMQPLGPSPMWEAIMETLRKVQAGELVPATTHYAECHSCGAEVEFKA